MLRMFTWNIADTVASKPSWWTIKAIIKLTGLSQYGIAYLSFAISVALQVSWFTTHMHLVSAWVNMMFTPWALYLIMAKWIPQWQNADWSSNALPTVVLEHRWVGLFRPLIVVLSLMGAISPNYNDLLLTYSNMFWILGLYAFTVIGNPGTPWYMKVWDFLKTKSLIPAMVGT